MIYIVNHLSSLNRVILDVSEKSYTSQTSLDDWWMNGFAVCVRVCVCIFFIGHLTPLHACQSE